MDDVRTIFERAPAQAPARRCPTCGHEAATFRAECPACGKRYDRRAPWLGDRARWALGIAAVLAVVALGAAVLPTVFANRDRHNAQVAREQRAREAAERARLAREQRPVFGRAPRSAATRTAMVAALQAAILADARARVAAGRLDGPVRSVECGTLTHGVDPYAGPVGRFDCVAVTAAVMQDGKRVASFGHPFVAAVRYRSGRWAFCKDNKAPGERGKALATVPLAPACLGVDGARRIGNGYAAP